MALDERECRGLSGIWRYKHLPYISLSSDRSVVSGNRCNIVEDSDCGPSGKFSEKALFSCRHTAKGLCSPQRAEIMLPDILGF